MAATVRRVAFDALESFFHKDPKALWQWSTNEPNLDAVRLATFGVPYREDRPIDGPPAFGVKHNHTLFRKTLERSWGFTDGDGARAQMELLLGPYNHATEFDFIMFAGEELIELERAEGARTAVWEARKRDLESFIARAVAAHSMSGSEAVFQFNCWMDLRTSKTFAEAAPPRVPLTTKAWISCALRSSEECRLSWAGCLSTTTSTTQHARYKPCSTTTPPGRMTQQVSSGAVLSGWLMR
ncbi:hypothetical protein [Corynebacterium cystitidis]|uniref:hypothetical protein n=1 Tax=Corynebacterium cystitidis TaxID=35757 RepID=UPI00211E2599|nr:hypothetical protein [Corynebacterium cystitidis]